MATASTDTKEKKHNDSPGVEHEEQAKEKTDSYAPDEETTEALGFILRQALRARDQREQPHHDFDGMTYSQDYQTNQDAAITFLTPKKNDDDVRINTSTSEKKIETMMNELLSMNIQSEINAFDMLDREIVGLGKDMEHLVLRTNQIEREEDVWVDIIRELLTQRAVFVEEVMVERTVLNGAYVVRRAEKRVVSGLRVYLGDISIPAYKFHEQPYYVKYSRISYAEARARKGDHPNFQYVKPGGTRLNEFNGDDFENFRFCTLANDEVEVLQYYSYIDGEYMETYNGIPMCEVGSSLPYQHEGYNMTMVTIKPIRSNFAYGKPPIASAKTIQALENETIRNMVRKFRQALEPPLATQSKTIFSRDIWAAGAVTQGISKDTFHKLVEHDGVTQSEMAMFELINRITEDFIGVSRLQQGQNSNKEMTATETLEQLRQGIKNLGLAVLATMRIRINCTYLRVYTITEDFIKPIGKRVIPGTDKIADRFMQFTITNADLGDGRRGKKIVQFRDTDLTPEEEKAIKDTEDKQELQGNYVRIKTINIVKLAMFPVYWYVTATQKPQPGSAINKILVGEKITQMANIEQLSRGQVQGNWSEIAEEAQLVWGSTNLFKRTPPSQLPPAEVNPVQNKAQELMGKIQAMSDRKPEGMMQSPAMSSQLSEAPRSRTRMPGVGQVEAQQ